MTAPAFILGCPRSGTTFLAEALEPLAGIEVRVGLVFPPPLPHLYATTADDDVKRLLEWSLQQAVADWGEFAVEARTWTLGQLVGGNLGLREAVAGFRRKRPVRTVVFKEPFLSAAPGLVLAAAPGAPVVHIVRDGRDAADSLRRTYDVLTDERLADHRTNEAPLGRRHGGLLVPWWVSEEESDAFISASPYLRCVWMWRELVRRAADGLEGAHGAGQTLTIRYEDLMKDPLGVGSRVASHLGHELNGAARRRLAAGHSRSIGAYRRLPPDEVEAATALARAELVRFEYQV